MALAFQGFRGDVEELWVNYGIVRLEGSCFLLVVEVVFDPGHSHLEDFIL